MISTASSSIVNTYFVNNTVTTTNKEQMVASTIGNKTETDDMQVNSAIDGASVGETTTSSDQVRVWFLAFHTSGRERTKIQ